jgi:hypothetical protein
VLYAHINIHLGLLDPLIRNPQGQHHALLLECGGTYNSWAAGNSLLNGASRALSRWCEIWQEIHKKPPGNGWNSMGFCKTGYNFYLVSQLVLEKGSLGRSWKIERNCDDSLEQLKVLLQSDGWMDE